MAMSEGLSAQVTGTTRDLPPQEDYDFFCAAIADIYVGVHPARPSGAFAADFALYDFGLASLGIISVPAVEAVRDRTSLARVPDDAYFLNVCRSPWTLSQFNRSWRVPSGAPVLLDNSAPFRIVYDYPDRRARMYSLRVPRTIVDIADVRAVNDRIPTTEAGSGLSAQTRLLVSTLESGRADIAAAMSLPTIGLLGAMATSETISSINRLTLYKSVAHERITDPTLTVREIAREVGCSTRLIQAAFAGEGETFASWLTNTRLDVARERLKDHGWRLLTVNQISAATGFTDPSTFYRAYRNRYGSTPAADR